jgi:hypothetical protein
VVEPVPLRVPVGTLRVPVPLVLQVYVTAGPETVALIVAFEFTQTVDGAVAETWIGI